MEVKNWWFVRLTDSMGGWCVFKKIDGRDFPTLKSTAYATEQEAIDDMENQLNNEQLT